MSDYFDQTANPVTPIVDAEVVGNEAKFVQPQTPPTPPPQPIQPPPAPQPLPNEFKGLPVRAGGDRVFLIKAGRKYWISNPEAMSKLGFKLGDEARIDQETLDCLAEGEPLR
jgi:hypothetical protein